MHDLRWDQTDGAAQDHVRYRLNPADLRTVPMPELRSADARTLDAAQRGTQAHDTRTFDQQVVAELVRIVDALQAVVLRLDMIEETLRGMVTHE